VYVLDNKVIIDEVYVSTDDKTIKSLALEYEAKVIDRPENLSGDLEPTVSTVQHVLVSVFPVLSLNNHSKENGLFALDAVQAKSS
jgi:CMP-N-acetylneuraminic acid synthetase